MSAGSRLKPAKMNKNANISLEGYGLCFLGCTRYNHLKNKRSIKREYYITLLEAFDNENQSKAAINEAEKYENYRDTNPWLRWLN